MRSFFLMGLLAALSSSGQILIPTPQMKADLPAMCKALSLGEQVVGADKGTVANMMCEHAQFAQGIDLLVYSDRDDDRIAMTAFSFFDGKCDRLEIVLHYDDYAKRMSDAKELINELNYVFNEYNDIDLTVATYKPSSELSRSIVWNKPSNYVQLTLDEKLDKNTIKLSIMYSKRKKG